MVRDGAGRVDREAEILHVGEKPGDVEKRTREQEARVLREDLKNAIAENPEFQRALVKSWIDGHTKYDEYSNAGSVEYELPDGTRRVVTSSSYATNVENFMPDKSRELYEVYDFSARHPGENAPEPIVAYWRENPDGQSHYSDRQQSVLKIRELITSLRSVQPQIQPPSA